MKKIKYLAALMVCASLANAAIITPTSVTNSGTYTGIIADAGTALVNLIDGSGLTGTPVDDGTTAGGATHLGGYADIDTKWTTANSSPEPDFFAATNGTVQLDFDLGGAYDIASAYIWGYFNWGAGNSATAIDVSFSTDGVSYGNTQRISLDIPPVNDLPANAVDLSSAPTGVTHVRFLMKDNGYGATGSGGDRVGLGEVRFGTASVAPSPVVITTFTANPLAVTNGGTATLSWLVSDATGLSIDQGIGDVTGLTSTQVVVTANTTYTLTATNSLGSTNESTTVTITVPGSLLIDPSLELPFGGTREIPNTGWFSYHTDVTKSAIDIVDGYFGPISNNDGPNAVQIASYDENSGGTVYQSVELEAGTIYRLTVGVAQSDWVEKNDGKYALVFYNSNFSELRASTTNVVGMTGYFVDDYVEFTPTSDGIYNVGMRNVGYVPNTSGNTGGSTIFFDNVRLTVEGVVIPNDPIGTIAISGITGGQGVALSWDTSKHQPYNVQYKNDLVNDPDWSIAITNVIGTGSEITVTSTVNNAESYYRVVTP